MFKSKFTISTLVSLFKSPYDWINANSVDETALNLLVDSLEVIYAYKPSVGSLSYSTEK